jgi:hypothetical protein
MLNTSRTICRWGRDELGERIDREWEKHWYIGFCLPIKVGLLLPHGDYLNGCVCVKSECQYIHREAWD